MFFKHQGLGRAGVEWSAVPQCGSPGRECPVSKGPHSSAGVVVLDVGPEGERSPR